MGWRTGVFLLAFGAGTLYVALTWQRVVDCGAFQSLFVVDGLLSFVGAAAAFGDGDYVIDHLDLGDLIGVIAGIALVVGIAGLLSAGCGAGLVP